jgi:hypothetical protein
METVDGAMPWLMTTAEKTVPISPYVHKPALRQLAERDQLPLPCCELFDEALS